MLFVLAAIYFVVVGRRSPGREVEVYTEERLAADRALAEAEAEGEVEDEDEATRTTGEGGADADAEVPATAGALDADPDPTAEPGREPPD